MACAQLSLPDLADRYSTSPAELLAFLSSDRCLHEVAKAEVGLSLLVRTAALVHLTKAVAVLSDLLDDHAQTRPTITDPAARAAANIEARRTAQAVIHLAHYTVRPIAGLAPLRAQHAPPPLSRSPGEVPRFAGVRASCPTSPPP